jgi:hypothetical protein
MADCGGGPTNGLAPSDSPRSWTVMTWRVISSLLPRTGRHPGDVTAAYEDRLRALGLVDRNAPVTEIVAKKITEIAQTGERAIPNA